MIRFVIRKLLNKKWMSLALLFGNVLLLSLALSTPVYTRASLQRTLDLQFRDYLTENNEYPARLRVETPKIRGDGQEIKEKLLKMDERLMLTGEDLRMPVLLMRSFLSLGSKDAESDFPRREELNNFQVSAMSGLMDHIVLSDGSEIQKTRSEDGSVNGYLASQAMQRTHLALGEVLRFDDIVLPDGTNLTVRIAGDFVMKDPEDLYWVDSPADTAYRTCIFIDDGLFRELFLSEKSDTAVNAEWNLLYDYSDFSVEYVERDAEVCARLAKYMTQTYGFTAYFNFRNRFRDFVSLEKQIRTTYLVLQIPIFLLLILFIFMVSARMADNEESEIAVLSSRGVSRGQIFLSYLFQSFLVLLLASACAMALLFPLTKLLLSSNGFLEFIRRKDLKLSMDLRTLFYGFAAVLAAAAAMVLPTLRFAGNSVITQRGKKLSGMRKQSFWHRFFIDVILLGVALYGLYSFSSQKEALTAQVIAGEPLDPLLYLSTSAFMAGAGLFLLRLVPLLQGLLFRLFQKKWSPALFASHRQVQGTRREQGFIMVFLAMTVASGVFYASAARTIRENDERNIGYMNGADLVVREVWRDNSVELANRIQQNPALSSSPLTYYEPNYEKYESLPGFSSVTKVYRGEGQINADGISGKAAAVRIMGIEPKLFGETAEFDPSLMSVHWYDFLNALSLREDAVILSANYKAFGISIGDQVMLRTREKNQEQGVPLVVYGFVDYWPGYQPETSTIMEDRSVKKDPQYLAIARLDTLQRAWNVLPYEVWLKSDSGSTESFYKLREERNFSVLYVKDTASDILSEASGAVKQGTSGIFTVSFITALLLCFTGFLIYWISSVKNRELQFGVLRAMGMRFREILVMLLNEQFFVSLSAIAAGYAAGRLTAYLYMPVLRIAYSSADCPVPLLVVREASDELRLFAMIAMMVLLGLFIMYRIIRRMRISEALKLGED